MVTNLNKENFFNALGKRYPEAYALFKAWVDEYKASIGWNDIFNSNSDYQNMNGKNAIAPKLHDLPFELQQGIFLKFMFDKLHYIPAFYHIDAIKSGLELCFDKLQGWYLTEELQEQDLKAIKRHGQSNN